MNSAQKGSPHRQFAHSPHRQRVISLVIPNTQLLDRFTGQSGFDYTTPDPDWNSTSYYFGNGLENFEITNSERWTATKGVVNYITLRPNPETEPNVFSGLGVWGADRDNGFPNNHGKMRVWYPATGTIGFYTNPQFGQDFTLISYYELLGLNAPGVGSFYEANTIPVTAPPGGIATSLAILFFGVGHESLPATVLWDNYLEIQWP